jgi:short-subunit dehydrogenase
VLWRQLIFDWRKMMSGWAGACASLQAGQPCGENMPNVIGLLEVTKTVIPHFRARHSVILINVFSVGGKIVFPLGALYHGTKFAVEGLAEALSVEMRAIGVKVKLIEPGLIRTDFTGGSFDFSNNSSLTEYQPIVRKLATAYNNPDNPG